jgi:hypothetical protein
MARRRSQEDAPDTTHPHCFSGHSEGTEQNKIGLGRMTEKRIIHEGCIIVGNKFLDRLYKMTLLICILIFT